MEIIETILCWNILDKEDLLLFKNYSLDRVYNISHFSNNNVTPLMLLTNLSVKYSQISNIIEQYIKKIPISLVQDEINKMCNGRWTALDICIMHDHPDIKTIKILLENGAEPNQPDRDGATSYGTSCVYFNQPVMQLILEYDGINIKDHDDEYQDNSIDDKQKIIMNKMSHCITLLNTKN